MKLQIGGIIYNSLVNGEGNRTVIFFSGCKRNCKGCHNVELQDFNAGIEKDVNELVEEVIKQMDISDGVTLSGGDPIYQYEGLLALCKELKKHNINIWLYTGATYFNITRQYGKELLKYIDVMIDGEFMEGDKNPPKYRGSSNQSIIHFKEGRIDYVE